MKNNKILMSLVAASIAAMAAAPELMKSEDKPNDKKVIDLAQSAPKNLTAEQQELATDAKNQVSAMLNKKTPVMKVSESVSILVDNYGSNDESVKEKIYKDLKLAAVIPNQDSTTYTPGSVTPSTTPGGGSAAIVCHSACHGACHSACHGARGWR